MSIETVLNIIFATDNAQEQPKVVPTHVQARNRDFLAGVIFNPSELIFEDQILIDLRMDRIYIYDEIYRPTGFLVKIDKKWFAEYSAKEGFCYVEIDMTEMFFVEYEEEYQEEQCFCIHHH